jgi:hypothetical protein
MTDPEADAENSLRALARAVSFGFAAVVVGLSYPNIHCALRIGAVRQVFDDMLGGKPLPLITSFAFQAQPFLLAISVLVPVIAVVAVCICRTPRSLYIFGCLILLQFIELYFMWHVVSAPLLAIVSGMSGGE